MKKLSMLLMMMGCFFILSSATHVKRTNYTYYIAYYYPDMGCNGLFFSCPDNVMFSVGGLPQGLLSNQPYILKLQAAQNPTICLEYNLVSIKTGLCP